MIGCTVRRYEQLETSPETIDQELRPAVCEHRQENYSMDVDRVYCFHCVHSAIRMKWANILPRARGRPELS